MRCRMVDSACAAGRAAGLVLCGMLLLAASPAQAATLVFSEGNVELEMDRRSLTVQEAMHQPASGILMLKTNQAAHAVVRLDSGAFLVVEGGSQVTIEAGAPLHAMDASGRPVDATLVMVAFGSVVFLGHQLGDEDPGVIIATAGGKVSPVQGGQFLVSSTDADPSRAVVTIAVLGGDLVFNSRSGEPVPLGAGLLLVQRGDGRPEVDTLADTSEGADYTARFERASASTPDSPPAQP